MKTFNLSLGLTVDGHEYPNRILLNQSAEICLKLSSNCWKTGVISEFTIADNLLPPSNSIASVYNLVLRLSEVIRVKLETCNRRDGLQVLAVVSRSLQRKKSATDQS
jgi:hypothetical protein